MPDNSQELADWLEKEMRFNQTIGSHLAKLRENASGPWSELLEKLGISQSDIRNWELGISSPPCWKYYALIKSLGEDSYVEASEMTNVMMTEAHRLLRKRQNGEIKD